MNNRQQKIVMGFLYFLGCLIVLGTAAWLYIIYDEEINWAFEQNISDFVNVFLGINSHDDHPRPFVIVLGSLLLLGSDAFGILWLKNSASIDFSDINPYPDTKSSSPMAFLKPIFSSFSSSPHDRKVKRFLNQHKKISLLSQSAVKAYRIQEATKEYEHALKYYTDDEVAQTSAKDLWKRTVRELENLPIPNYTTSSFNNHIYEFMRLKEYFDKAYQSIMTIEDHSKRVATRGLFGEIAEMYKESAKQYGAAGLYCSNISSKGIENLTKDSWLKESLSTSEIDRDKTNWLNVQIKSSDVIYEAKQEEEKAESIRKISLECLPF
jgi:hypothetical protein